MVFHLPSLNKIERTVMQALPFLALFIQSHLQGIPSPHLPTQRLIGLKLRNVNQDFRAPRSALAPDAIPFRSPWDS